MINEKSILRSITEAFGQTDLLCKAIRRSFRHETPIKALYTEINNKGTYFLQRSNETFIFGKKKDNRKNIFVLAMFSTKTVSDINSHILSYSRIFKVCSVVFYSMFFFMHG